MTKKKTDKKRWLNLAAFVVGVAILGAFVANLGFEETREQLFAVGWGFFGLIGLMLFALILEAFAWRIAIGHPIPIPRLVGTAMAGTAINSLTPMGEGGELIKVNLMSAHIPMSRSISSVLVWNICFRITKHLLIFLVILLMPVLAAGVLDSRLFAAFLLAAVLSAIPTVLFFWALKKGSAGLVVKFLQKIPAFRSRAPEKLEEAAQRIDNEVRAFTGPKRGQALRMCCLLILARVFSALEIVAVMKLLGADVGFMHGLFLYCATMILRNFLSISPVQLGVAEGGESFLFKLLGFSLNIGFAQAFVRVLRLMLFNLIGLAYLGSRGLNQKSEDAPPEQNQESPDNPVSAQP